MILGVVLCVLVFASYGCGLLAQPGETAAEGHRRHLRNLAVNQQNLVAEIDRALLFDKPSTTAPKRVD